MSGEGVYIYYSVPVDQHGSCARQVHQFQAMLKSQWPGLVAELLQRPEASAGMETWMETYRQERGLGLELLRAIQQGAIDAGLPSPRHTELFIPLSPLSP